MQYQAWHLAKTLAAAAKKNSSVANNRQQAWRAWRNGIGGSMAAHGGGVGVAASANEKSAWRQCLAAIMLEEKPAYQRMKMAWRYQWHHRKAWRGGDKRMHQWRASGEIMA
jgi:hypothetical protein